MPAKVMVLDFTEDDPGYVGGTNVPKQKVLMTKKQIRQRARRRGKITREEFETLYKPIDEWDDEELARGRPRNAAGNFKGPAPMWITREMHETIMSRFSDLVKQDMRVHTVTALDVVRKVMTENRVDAKGKPLVPPSTKLDAAKFLIEHEVGKPTQRTETDISVKLQAILANATASPIDGVGVAELSGSQHTSAADFAEAYGLSDGVIDAEVVDDEEYIDDD